MRCCFIIGQNNGLQTGVQFFNVVAIKNRFTDKLNLAPPSIGVLPQLTIYNARIHIFLNPNFSSDTLSLKTVLKSKG